MPLGSATSHSAIRLRAKFFANRIVSIIIEQRNPHSRIKENLKIVRLRFIQKYYHVEFEAYRLTSPGGLRRANIRVFIKRKRCYVGVGRAEFGGDCESRLRGFS